MRRRLDLFIYALILAACSDKRVPPLPVIDTSRFQPAVRQVTEAALREAQAKPSDPEAVARLGMVLHAHDQFSAAVACYRRAAALDPKRVEYPYYEGAALSADGKFNDAVAPLSRAAAMDPRSAPIRLRYADALLESGRPADAAREYRAVIELNPSIASAHFGLGRTLKGNEAIAEYSKAVELFPRYGAAQFALAAEYRKAGRAGDATRVLEGYEQNRRQTPPLDDPLLAAVYALNTGTTGMTRRAQALEREGKLAEAAQVSEQIIHEDPKNEQVWMNLVSLYARLGDSGNLERAYKQATTIGPNRAEPHYNYGLFCLSANKVPEARRAFETATEIDPRNAEAWNNLAATVERSGQLDKAAAYYRRAIALRPDSRTSHFGLGRIYANQRKFDGAISEFEKTLSPEDDQTPGYLYALGAVHARAGHRQQSIDHLNKARARASGKGQAALVAAIDRDLGALGARQ